VFAAMLDAVDAAAESVAFESYTFADCSLGERFRAALMEACERGVRVRVLIDGIGSMQLPDYFWHPLQAAGAEVRIFNPIAFGRLGIRNHRKLLACDGRVAFIGGFNVAHDYEGDGVTRGWRDVGLRVDGALAAQLDASFDQMFALADLRQKRFPRLRRTRLKRTLVGAGERLLLCGPGRGASPLLRSLRRDLRRLIGARSAERGLRAAGSGGSAAGQDRSAEGEPETRNANSEMSVRFAVPYFLPPFRLRRDLQRLARRGGRVQLVLPAKLDVTLSLLAGRSLYQRLLRAGVEIHEYQPQVLHAKLFLLGDAVYVGSANLDPRSLHLNYELMVRLNDPAAVGQANEIFDDLLLHSRRIEKEAWKSSRSWWTRWQERWANFILARVDAYLALRQWRQMRGGIRKSKAQYRKAVNPKPET
jgi:cardiolipin synthase